MWFIRPIIRGQIFCARALECVPVSCLHGPDNNDGDDDDAPVDPIAKLRDNIETVIINLLKQDVTSSQMSCPHKSMVWNKHLSLLFHY